MSTNSHSVITGMRKRKSILVKKKYTLAYFKKRSNICTTFWTNCTHSFTITCQL